MADSKRLVKEFVTERNCAWLSLDEVTIRQHNRKWRIRTPDDPIVFWVGIHKARTACTSLPLDARLYSKAWLSARGYESLDRGELNAA